MIEIEKYIVSACIEYPGFAYIAFDNLDELDFQNTDNRKIFIQIKKFRDEKININWSNVFIYLKGFVNEGYLPELTKYSLGLHPLGMVSYLTDKVRLLKRELTKKKLLIEIKRELENPSFEIEKVVEIAQRGMMVYRKDESGDFNVAFEEYLNWKSKKRTNVNTGYALFDNRMDDFLYGELIGIMGRTFTGKTFFALNILKHLLNNTALKIGFFSLEMSKATIVERMMQLEYKMSRYEIGGKVRDGSLNLNLFLDRYKSLNVYSHIYSVNEIAGIIERDGLNIVFIDFLQQLKKPRGQKLYESTTNQMSELKEVAKNQEVVIFLMIQLSRKAVGGWLPVTIDMARDSGSIEEDCDFLMGIWNLGLNPNIKEDKKTKYQGQITIKLLKNKRGTTIGDEFWFDKETGEIKEVEKKATGEAEKNKNEKEE